jgi:acetolactate synthase-1/2/3 large subunit
MATPPRHGGDVIAAVLSRWNIPALFTLCGGHISPILVGAEAAGLKVLDCRDEKSAVFAADAFARLTGLPGVVAVTAGPGVTNALTALKNAQLAQSPLVLLGGATATVLKGRGALQDIDQMAVVRSAVKWSVRCRTVPQLASVVDRALEVARSGVPGPVFVEVPVDVLYPEATVKEWYLKESGVEGGTSLGQRALGLYLKGHLYRQFHLPHFGLSQALQEAAPQLRPRKEAEGELDRVVALARGARRPVLLVGSQALVNCKDPAAIARAVTQLGMPTWLGGMARGLLGHQHPLQFRHARGKALKEADLVVVCGFPFDFRLKYGLGISRKATVVSANLSALELTKNRKPEVAVQMNAGEFLVEVARRAGPLPSQPGWVEACRQREAARDEEIRQKARPAGELVDPVHLFQRLEAHLGDDAVLVADGGDFVATAAYILRPRSPLSWLDPGVFGTLGVGGGFAVGAAAARPTSQVWLIWGDGSSAYSLAEFDTFVRHGMSPIAVVGTDASWGQIGRDQTSLLGSAVGTGLRRTDYHLVAQGYGGVGLLLTDGAQVDAVLDEAQALARAGKPVCINVHLGKSDFREGSISI